MELRGATQTVGILRVADVRLLAYERPNFSDRRVFRGPEF